MEQKTKYPIRQNSITNMTKFLNLLSGKTYRSNEILALQKPYNIRANFLSYAKQMNYCKKDESGAYYFLNRVFDPIHAKHLIEVSNKYNNEILAKKKRRLEEKESTTTKTTTKNVELNDSLELQISTLKSENINLEKEVYFLYSENEKLKNDNTKLEDEISDLLDSKANLNKSLDYCNKEIRGLNDIIWNNNNESLQKENDLLKEKISSLEKLISIYFK